MRKNIRLDVTSGPLKGEHFDFDEADVFIVGRASDCHARLPADDHTASRHHFFLDIKPPAISIRDLGSLNGTFVNGNKIGSRKRTETPEEGAKHHFDAVTLTDGDKIQVGETVFELEVTQPVYCPQCGRVIEGRSTADQQQRRDARCDRCQASSPVLASRAHDLPGPATGADRESPLAMAVRLLIEKPGAAARARDGSPHIAGYEIGPELGRGGMGAVYRARRVSDDADVAIKVMLAEREADEHARWLFEREVEMQQRLSGHPNCVPVFDWDMEGVVSYFAMEFCPGGSLDGLIIRRGGRLTVEKAEPLMLGALEGLVFAHSLDVVHRDLKPQNVLLTDRDGGTPKLTDFGLSKDFELAGMSGPLGTTTGTVGGTPGYLPREQVVDFKYTKPVSDVWGLAATFYNMLTGAFPRDFPDWKDPINIILSVPPVPIRQRDSSIPRRLAAVLDRALVDDVSERYQTAAELRDALVGVL